MPSSGICRCRLRGTSVARDAAFVTQLKPSLFAAPKPRSQPLWPLLWWLAGPHLPCVRCEHQEGWAPCRGPCGMSEHGLEASPCPVWQVAQCRTTDITDHPLWAGLRAPSIL